MIYGDSNANQYSLITGRGTREEEAAQGPRHEASQVHPPFRQRYHDWWQAEGTLDSIENDNFGVPGMGRSLVIFWDCSHVAVDLRPAPWLEHLSCIFRLRPIH